MNNIERDKRRKDTEKIGDMTEGLSPKAISYIQGFIAGAALDSGATKKEDLKDGQPNQPSDNK